MPTAKPYLEPKVKRKKPLKEPDEPMEVDEIPRVLNDVQEKNGTGDLDHISDDEEGGFRVGDIYIPPAPKQAIKSDGTGPRLIITHIVNINFKSYAGTQILGPFHKSFTAIIGPNGSGKSNVIDSMLFVFGYRASRMRSKKISQMIHKSTKFPDCVSTTVEVHFCEIYDGEGDTFFSVPDSEFAISRTAFQDNSSSYQLNNKRVQYKEIAHKLRSLGIDLNNNRFLILQGEVEQIAMMKPKAQTEHEVGMLEYLEDIIGSNRFKVPLQKLADKVDVLNDNRKEKLNRVRTAENDWRTTHEPMAEAVDIVNRTNAAVKMRNWVLQKYIHESRKIVAKEETTLNELKATLAKINEKIASVQEEMSAKRAVFKAEQQKVDELTRQKQDTLSKLQACKKKTDTIQEDTTMAKKKKKNLDQLIEQEKRKIIELELIPEKNKREIEECEKLLERHTESKRVAEEELATMMAGVRARTQGLQAEKDTLQTRQMQLKAVLVEATKAHKVAESKLRLYIREEATANSKLSELKEALAKTENDLNTKNDTNNALLESIPPNERELSEMEDRLETLKREETNVAKEVRTLRVQLEESQQAMSANRSRGRVLDALMRERKNGTLQGILGRLGDLGGIDSKYDVAISTCCGALDNVVTSNVDTAQACVEYLRDNNVGRATFIALDKQEHLREYIDKKVAYPENVPRLFDLIKVKDKRILPAFYFALRETLVANDLEQATRIAYGTPRYRVVTLKGDLIEIAGTMAGGGKSTMRGRMGSSVQQDTSEQDPAAVQQKADRLAASEQRLSELREEQARIENNVAKLSQTLREGKNKLSKINAEIKSLSDMLPVLKNKIAVQERRVASVVVDPAQRAEFENESQETMTKLEEAKANLSEVESKVQDIEKQISDEAGSRVKALQKPVDDLTNKISMVTAQMKKLTVAINSSKRNVALSKNKLTQMETDYRETETNMENLKEKKKAVLVETEELKKMLDEIEEKFSEGTGDFSTIKAEIEKLQKKEDKRLSEKLEVVSCITAKEKSLKEYKAREPAFQRDLKELVFEDPGVADVPNLDPIEPLKTFTEVELENEDLEELRKKHEVLKSRLGERKPNLKAIQEYKAKEETYLSRVHDLETITAERNKTRSVLEEVSKKRHDEFFHAFNIITGKLKEMYQMITLGGDAELELVDSMNPFAEGVTFSVRPPNKSWKNIANLSGGEKTLSSLALVFALHYFKPTPLYVMDEIDAALDFKNVSIVANYIKERTKNAQFIIISLRYNMFETCNRLVGIYKTEDCTKSVTVENSANTLQETPTTATVLNGVS